MNIGLTEFPELERVALDADVSKDVGDYLQAVGFDVVMANQSDVDVRSDLAVMQWARRENRFCTPNTRFLLHQPMGGIGGKATDIDIEAREILKMRDRLNRIIAAETGQPVERVAKDTDRNYWMDPEEAKDYGIVGEIVERIDEVA